MQNIVPIYKYQGETPLGCIDRLRQSFQDYIDMPITYAGRLDPMAEGLLLLLIGEECKNKDHYIGLNKEYVVDIALGIGSDTHDILGMINSSQQNKGRFDKEIDSILQDFVGKQRQQYPIFSSKPVDGKPLFIHAREGNIGNVNIPDHEIEIFSIENQGIIEIPFKALQHKAIQRIMQVKGDFRQLEIIDAWKQVSLEDMPVIRLKIKASSGTYMRQLAYDIGQKMGISAIAWRIYRSAVGRFRLRKDMEVLTNIYKYAIIWNI